LALLLIKQGGGAFRSGVAEFLPQTPSFRCALAWAGEFLGRDFILPYPCPDPPVRGQGIGTPQD